MEKSKKLTKTNNKFQKKENVKNDDKTDTKTENKCLDNPKKSDDGSLSKNFKKTKFVKNMYQNRVSFFDDCSENSEINKSPFKGFRNLGKVIGLFVIITIPIIRSIEKGNFFETQIYNLAEKDFFMVLGCWPLFYGWTYTSFFIQKLAIAGLPSWALFTLQHTSQSLMFIASTLAVFHRDWGATHTAFIFVQTMIHFMKMHSYTHANRDLREAYLQELDQGKTPTGSYPTNINLKDFNYFLLAPTLCYDVNYPRSGPFRLWYCVDKGIHAFGCLLLQYIIASEYIIPNVLVAGKLSYLEGLLKFLTSMIWFFLVFFVFLFEYYLNFFAEITRFGDREFYQDWWNSSGWDEFARKWNRPVHEFLYRHVYLEAINRYKSSPLHAQFYAFFFSACLHELILILIFRFIKPFLIFAMLLQIPMIFCEKKFMKYKGTTSGNLFFWWSMIIGIPLISNLYVREFQQIIL